MASSNQENHCSFLKNLPNKLWDKVVDIAKTGKKLAKDDPRRIVHALKVGLALTLVSLFYYFNPLYEGLGVNAIWAVLTVVVVFEFSVGATFGKGINRMIATFIGGALGIGCHRIATLSGDTGEPILIATFVCIMATLLTFTRFFPKLKARYDYGLMIFILTFSLVSVSGYRDSQVLKMAHMRVSTILIGSFASIIICVCIYPVWIGEELHNLVLGNIEKLGSFLQGFGNEYFKVSQNMESDNGKSFLEEYKSVLTTKANEENMVNLARWEPPHGKFKLCHPWKQYLKIGTLARECACKIDALNTNLHSVIQSPMEIRNKFTETCRKVSIESGKALKELALTTKKMERSSTVAQQVAELKAEADKVKSLLKINKWEGAALVDIVPVATVALILLGIVDMTEKIADAIDELATVADFKNINPTISPEQPHLLRRGTVQPIPSVLTESHLITIRE